MVEAGLDRTRPELGGFDGNLGCDVNISAADFFASAD
jgi:hypothetical protein